MLLVYDNFEDSSDGSGGCLNHSSDDFEPPAELERKLGAYITNLRKDSL